LGPLPAGARTDRRARPGGGARGTRAAGAHRDESVEELRSLRADVVGLADDPELARRIGERFDRARFPFRHDRRVPRITVAGAVDEVSLEPGFRNPKPWTSEAKRRLIAAGYALTDRELRAYQERG
jgi:hypothetical protein